MSKKTNRKVIGIAGGSGVVGVFAILLLFGNTNQLIDGNISNLAFVQNFSELNCEAYNQLSVTNVGGQKVVLANQRDGFNPLVPDTLSFTRDGVEIETFHIELLLECEGDLIEDSDVATLTGSIHFRLCGDPSNGSTRCLLGDDRAFISTDNGILATQTSANVGFDQVILPDDVIVLVRSFDFSASELESVFPIGTTGIHFKSSMLPVFTITFVHPTLGIVQATYDARTVNDQIISQYGGFSNLAPPVPDTDGDGILDNVDACIGQPETFNGFQDNDGCPDVNPATLDDDNDGFTNDVDDCANTPAGANVDFNTLTGLGKLLRGCSQAQADAIDESMDDDNDGVPNSIDVCPLIIGTQSNGCPPTSIQLSIGNDADGDGVEDQNDQCPTISGLAEFNGCLTQFGNTVGDSDSDGVVDELDMCSGTLSGVLVDLDGCETSTPPTITDSDNDGVLDTFDLCPNTFSGDTVDADGCALSPLTVVDPIAGVDTDGDGILDVDDVCITDFGTIERNGCPANPFDLLVDIVTPDFDADPIDPLFEEIVETPTTQPIPQPQTSVSGEITDNDITILIIIVVVVVLISVGILGAKGKIKV